MNNYHVEVHSRDRQIEHYNCQDCVDDVQAKDRVANFYRDKGQRIGLFDRENDLRDIGIPYLIFTVTKLEVAPVVYLTGEYRSQFPL